MLLFQEDAELLFPARLIPAMRDLRGADFRDLIDRLQNCHSEGDPEVLGFTLMMVRLGSCMTCTADSYRAMNGCTYCAKKTVRGYKGTDVDLRAEWESACREIEHWRLTGEAPNDL
jgi:hypothetical protein